ncbi:MAG: hypothetical protein JETCAE03_35050 [Ignavibacteriaceae bacterium]|jgi:predicted RNase H-related nuclease YkuK (DUF458 family)|nr:MAG: hypothetical protein JETCAE03_35050 [Ignavibacteriaceae bacterium]
MKNFVWTKIDGTQINDLASYIRNYMESYKWDYEIYIGTDSQRIRRKGTVLFSSVICIYRKGMGAHVIYSKHRRANIKDKFERLREEVKYSIEIAKYLNENDVLIRPDVLTVHLDVSPQSKNDSNKIYQEVIAKVLWEGYQCEAKPNAPGATYAADWVVKNKQIPFHELDEINNN